MRSRVCFIIAFIIFASGSINAQEPEPSPGRLQDPPPVNRWYDGIFVEGSGLYYAVPELFSELVEPKIGFRAALGYEFYCFRVAVETGHTQIVGNNPFVLDIRLTPLTFKFGYALPIWKGLGVQADLGIGAVFSETIHYPTAVHLIQKNHQISPANSLLAGARLYAFYEFPQKRYPQKLAKIYAGGGLDAIFEHQGQIFLPAVEVGISLKPFAFIPRKPQAQTTEEIFAEEHPDTGELVFAHIPENQIIEDGAQGKTIRLLNAVYFHADSTYLVEEYRPLLDEAGLRLQADPELRLILRGYAAPFGTEAAQVTLSAARAWYCGEYLMRVYGIAEERIHMEFFGADKTPEWKGANWESWRCVELILEEKE